jgi:hypothetical protein
MSSQDIRLTKGDGEARLNSRFQIFFDNVGKSTVQSSGIGEIDSKIRKLTMDSDADKEVGTFPHSILENSSI